MYAAKVRIAKRGADWPKLLTGSQYWGVKRGMTPCLNFQGYGMITDEKRETFGFRNFGKVNLGDKRRTKRLVKSVDAMCRHPGGTLPDKLNQPPDLRGFYRLMNRPETTHEVVFRAHADQTCAQISALGPAGIDVLRLHDATELDYTTKKALSEEMGQIGQGTRRGYICHNSLAVRADTGETLGLVSQILHHRANVPKKETTKARRKRANRESRLWLQGVQASGAAPAGVRYIDVSDSLSDTFEYMAYQIHNDGHFVLRARENRKLTTPCAKQDYLFDAVRHLPVMGHSTLEVSVSDKREKRTAKMCIAFSEVTLAVPTEHLGEYPKVPLTMWVVRIWEPNTPPGEEPLEWILLTNVPVTDTAAALERVSWYQNRWIIEELHKGMKTGCGIETLQFDTIEAVEPTIAVISAVATTLLRLRDAARAPDADVRPATEIVDPEYVDVLAKFYKKSLDAKPSVLQFYKHVARLGGHQNRKCDGFPGWITLWRGWMKLQSMVDGYRVAHEKPAKSCGKT